MGKKILATFLLTIAIFGYSAAQLSQLTSSPFTISVNQSFTGTGIVQGTQSTGSANSSPRPPAGSRIVWIEFGDGGFTTNASSNRQLAAGQIPVDNNWLFISSRVYDTVRDMLRIATGAPFSQNRLRPSSQSDNDPPQKLSGSEEVLITPNAYNIINRDTMSMAVTYKFTPQLAKTYYLIFNYNNNVFLPMAGGNNPTSNNTQDQLGFNNMSGQYVKYARVFHNEIYLPPTSIPNGLINYVASQIGSVFTNFAAFKIPTTGTNPLTERNMFFSLITKNGMAEGMTTSLNATLVERNDDSGVFSILDTNNIVDLPVLRAHDPNYIVQSPVCLQLPITPRFFNYHLHFQNTGAGPASHVNVTLHFTPGFDFNTFQILNARFSDRDYHSANQQSGITITRDQANNTITLEMDYTGNRGLSNNLLGTNAAPDPYVNPETMGDVYFRMKSTTQVPYFLTSQAGIEFYSHQTTTWELPVYTNTAISGYSDCCNCEIFNCGKRE